MEKLNRGLVAVRINSGQVFLSWRFLGTDPSTAAFVLRRGNTTITPVPLADRTNFIDNTTTDSIYTINLVVNGVEQPYGESASVWKQQYLTIPLQIPPGGRTPDGVAYNYSANDCSVGDLDGDGEYDIVLKWDPSNSHDNSQSGYTGNVYLDAYKLNGTHLWRIDLGRNIRAGAHYTQFMVYDFDGDGKAEVACKTADGTKDGANVVIGNPNADYRNPHGYVLDGPEFLTVFNGETGKAMATTNYIPPRGNVSAWGDDYGNRVDRFIAAVAYVDGERPSLIMGRGYYTRLVRVAWDWRNGTLTHRWTFDSSSGIPGDSVYAGQGNHHMSVGDVDGDGKDEVCNGASTIDDNGRGLYANGKGHGDALHMTDIDPERPGQEVWQCQEIPAEYGDTALDLHDGRIGNIMWGVPGVGDVGRAMAADIDPRYKGLELWGATGVLYNCKGTEIATNKPTINFGIWWDGDLSRELLDGTRLDKWDYTRNASDRLISFYDYDDATDNNGSKRNPGLSADLLGDWREEVLLRSADNTKLLLFTTVIPSNIRLRTLMHDPQYRVAIAWQNSAYNQPPHPGFYLGTGMSELDQPNIRVV